MSAFRQLLVLSALLSLVPCAGAQTESDLGSDITVILSSGETLTGRLIAVDAIGITIDHPVLGNTTISRTGYQLPAPEPEVVEPESPWSTSLDAALNGSRGNNQNQNLRVALNSRRDGDDAVDVYNLIYNRASSETRNPTKDTDKTADRFYGEARREWRLDDTLWRPFLQGTVEIDEFKDYTWRGSIAVGGAYPIIDEEDESLTGRLGLGANREFGGADESWTPEALLGLDYRHQIDAQQSFAAGIEVLPNLEDQGEYRSIMRAQYEVDINPEDPWHLTLGAERFEDSDPEAGTSKIDLNYFVGLGYTF